ncbi:hypothetical protein TorRG33x02_204110 [Trema orientale]|uniref:Transmembrane protein n=1 Tax=Trema orientale TaxID=63057 RepID=A0A2P5EE94_TREOI|nr:hypothetical protein TorRG33x02_204110 [Trema orientale]
MGALGKLIDAILLLFLTVVAIAAPLIDSQTVLPTSLFPDVLVDLKNCLSGGSYLILALLIYKLPYLTNEMWKVAILSEMIRSGKASDKLLMLYWPFFGLGVLATLRGLLPQSGKTAKTVGNGPAFSRKKKA